MLKKWMNSQYFVLGLLAGIGLIGFIITAILVIFHMTNGFDSYVVSYLNQFAVKYYTKTAIFISQMGHDYGMIYLYFIILAIFVYKKFYKEGLFFAAAMQSAFFFNLLVKEIIQRPRPPLDMQIIKFYDWSYASGHMIKSVCLYGTLMFICMNCIKRPWLKGILIAVLSVLVLAIGFSRFYLANHYPTDVIGGFFLGLFLLNFWIMLYKAQSNS